MYVCIQSTDFSFLVLGKQTKKWAECKLFCKVFLHILSWIAENFLFFPFFGHFSIFNMERSECSVDLRKTIQNLENMKKNSCYIIASHPRQTPKKPRSIINRNTLNQNMSHYGSLPCANCYF